MVSASLLVVVKGEYCPLFPFCLSHFFPVLPRHWASPGARSFYPWLSSLIQLIPTTLSRSLMLLGHIRALMLVDRGVWQNPVLEQSKQQRARQGTRLWNQQPKVSVLLSCMVAQCVLKRRWAAPWFEGSANEGGSKPTCWHWASLCAEPLQALGGLLSKEMGNPIRFCAKEKI